MMEAERRQSPRFNPEGLKASIFLDAPDQDTINMEGKVIDISHTGVKIKLKEPMPISVDRKIRIEFLLPESGIPFSISGVLKHHNSAGEMGLHYMDCPVVEALDNFIFECIKLAKHR
jgi:c-di-GMP-binding flagellar brake protein YcgR